MMKDCIIDEEIYRIEYIYVSTKFCSHTLQPHVQIPPVYGNNKQQTKSY